MSSEHFPSSLRVMDGGLNHGWRFVGTTPQGTRNGTRTGPGRLKLWNPHRFRWLPGTK